VKSNSPLISVILPVYNSESYILKCLESLKNQSNQNFELILIDDGSTDETLLISKKYLKIHFNHRYRLIINRINIGITKSLNKGVKVAKGKYLARADADDIYEPNRFELQLKFLEKNSNISLVGSNVKYIDKNEKFLNFSDLPIDHFNIWSRLFFHNPLIHSTIFFRRDIFKKSPYNEKFNTTQDYDMYCRIINCYKIVNIKKPLANYRIHNQSISKTKHHIQKRNTLMIQKNFYTLNFDNYFPLKKFKLFNNFFMSDYNHIINNVKDFKKFLLDMIDLLNNLKKKTKNKDLDNFFLERLLIFSKNSSEYKFYILKIILKTFNFKDIVITLINLILKKIIERIFIFMNKIKFEK
tara:strand:+ start:499 stop:1560 length:1062 start_codon:yes stop_codon:yes gene_type:complete